MARFFITMNRQITVRAQFDVEAGTEEEARQKALELASWDTPRHNRDKGIEWETDPIQWLDASDPEVNRVVALD